MKTGPLVLSFSVLAATEESDADVSFLFITPKGGRECSQCAWDNAKSDEEREKISCAGALCDAHNMELSIEGTGAHYFIELFDQPEMLAKDGILRIYGRAEWVDEDEDFELEKWELEPVKETNG